MPFWTISSTSPVATLESGEIQGKRQDVEKSVPDPFETFECGDNNLPGADTQGEICPACGREGLWEPD